MNERHGEHAGVTGRRPDRAPMPAMLTGAKGRCPNCGEGKLFSSFVTSAEECNVCGQAFHHHRADDLPAYLVIFIVGHIVVGAFMGTETLWELTSWQHLAIWVPVTIIASIALLRPAKGMVIGLQWALYMHGFGGDDDDLPIDGKRGEPAWTD